MPAHPAFSAIFIGKGGNIRKRQTLPFNFYQIFPEHITNSIIFHGNRQRRHLFLTFDDGPDALYTPVILDCLKELKIQASFFVLGEKVERFPEIFRRIQTEGHNIGIHGYTHHTFLFQKSGIIREQIKKTQKLLDYFLGKRTMFLRPPFGRFGWNTIKIARQQGLKIILWDILPGDYLEKWSVSDIVNRVSAQIKGGSIIVFHDNLENTHKVTKSLVQIIENARHQGYQFLPVEELF
jgi:peptidoglycan/xylan/chitin deacetylase (PgdA/CDA1 family)